MSGEIVCKYHKNQGVSRNENVYRKNELVVSDKCIYMKIALYHKECQQLQKS